MLDNRNSSQIFVAGIIIVLHINNSYPDRTWTIVVFIIVVFDVGVGVSVDVVYVGVDVGGCPPCV